MEEAFNEIAHPYGGVAYVEPLRRRAAFPSRQMVAYDEGDHAGAAVEEGEIASGDGEQATSSTSAAESKEHRSSGSAAAAERTRGTWTWPRRSVRLSRFSNF